MFERFTEKAINIISTAQKEASESCINVVYPEHILLAILETKSNICSRLLVYAGMKPDDFREHILNKYPNMGHKLELSKVVFSDYSQSIIKLASELAKTKTNSYIMPEHILLALILVAEQNYTTIQDDLKKFNVDIEKTKQTLLKLVEKTNKKGVLFFLFNI